jgi:hypothetical protein
MAASFHAGSCVASSGCSLSHFDLVHGAVTFRPEGGNGGCDAYAAWYCGARTGTCLGLHPYALVPNLGLHPYALVPNLAWLADWFPGGLSPHEADVLGVVGAVHHVGLTVRMASSGQGPLWSGCVIAWPGALDVVAL